MNIDFLDYIGYHEKWHGQIQNNRPCTINSINEILIKAIFDILKINNGNFVEFGAWDGVHNSNARILFQNGWKGLFILSI